MFGRVRFMEKERFYWEKCFMTTGLWLLLEGQSYVMLYKDGGI